MIQREERKLGRKNYWKALVTKELRFILAMVWYFKIELIRTKQLPEYVTISQIDKIPSLIQDIKKQALLTYNMVFRDCDQSKIIILDTG